MFRRTLALAALAVAACDFPTAPPLWEQTWVVPAEAITVGVGELLPAGVRPGGDGTTFLVDVAGAAAAVTLGEMCAECQAVDGTTAPKPAFAHTLDLSTTLPQAVISAVVAGGSLGLRVAHDLNFDPLRPSSDPAADRGYMRVDIASAGTVVARDSVSGDTVAFDSATVLAPSIAVSPADVSETLAISLRLHSPAGDPVEVDTSDTLGVTLLPTTLAVTEATVEAEAIAVDAPGIQIDLAAVDAALVDRVQRGAVRIDVSNPFTLSGTLDLRFDFGSQALHRTLPLEPGQATTTLAFTGAELRSMLLAGSVTVSARGTVGSPGGAVTLVPGQELLLDAALEIVLLVGGSGGEG